MPPPPQSQSPTSARKYSGYNVILRLNSDSDRLASSCPHPLYQTNSQRTQNLYQSALESPVD